MEISEFTSRLAEIKKLENAVQKLGLGKCDVSNVDDEGITITISFKNSRKRVAESRPIGFC